MVSAAPEKKGRKYIHSTLFLFGSGTVGADSQAPIRRRDLERYQRNFSVVFTTMFKSLENKPILCDERANRKEVEAERNSNANENRDPPKKPDFCFHPNE